MISRQQEPRKQKVDRDDAKRWCTNGYANWSETESKHRVRINRNNFEFIYSPHTPTLYFKNSH